MDLDDDDEADQVDESSEEEEEEPRTLMVTLRYGKGTNPPAATNGDAHQTNGVDHHEAHAALAGPGAPRQPETHIPAPVEPPLQPAPPPMPIAPQPHAAYVPRGIPPSALGIAQDNADPHMLPKLDGMFSAPVVPQQQPAQYPVAQPAQQQQQQPVFPPTLPSPTTAANWQ
jgi:hypothetical protein